jgi:hypothetical protein
MGGGSPRGGRSHQLRRLLLADTVIAATNPNLVIHTLDTLPALLSATAPDNVDILLEGG